VLEHYRRFLHFRKAHPAFAKGEIEFLNTDGQVLAFVRSYGNEKLFCLFNMSGTPAAATLPNEPVAALEGHGFAAEVKDRTVNLPAWGAYFARLV